MNLGNITTPNKKGQIVIPKQLRDAFGITADAPVQIKQQGQAILIQPIKEVITNTNTEDSYPAILSKTQGTWSHDTWDDSQASRRDIELAAAAKRKQSW